MKFCKTIEKTYMPSLFLWREMGWQGSYIIDSEGRRKINSTEYPLDYSRDDCVTEFNEYLVYFHKNKKDE